MSAGSEDSCQCDVCNSVNTHKTKPKNGTMAREPIKRGEFSRPTRGQTHSRGPRGRPPGLHGRLPLGRGPVDDDGLPDHIIRWLTILKKEGKTDRDFKEIPSLEHHLENSLLAFTTSFLAKYPSFAPRVGELVLFYNNIDGELQRDPANGQYRIYDPNIKVFKGYPKWLGGVITQVPIEKEPVTLADIHGKGAPKKLAVNASGFRVECLPDINSKDKNLTKQYTHVPLSHIRPMAYWQDVVINEHSLSAAHPSIKNVLKVTRTISLIGRYKLVGLWPNAHIFAKGIFLGWECIWAGDVVRLLPDDEEEPEQVQRVMHIRAFILSMNGLEPEPADRTIVTGDRCENIKILVRGQIFTHSPPAADLKPVLQEDLPEVMHAYGQWYIPSPSSPSSSSSSGGDASPSSIPSATTEHNIDAVRILGRLPSYTAMKHYQNSITPQAALNKGLKPTNDARAYALATDHRLLFNRINDHEELGKEEGKRWFWCDTRAEALDIESFNGVEVGCLYDAQRDVARMQRVFDIVKGSGGGVTGITSTKIQSKQDNYHVDDDDDGASQLETLDAAPTTSIQSTHSGKAKALNTPEEDILDMTFSPRKSSMVMASAAATITTTTQQVDLSTTSSSSSSIEEDNDANTNANTDPVQVVDMLNDDDNNDNEEEEGDLERRAKRMKV